MKKDKMIKNETPDSFEDQKLDLIRLRIKIGYYKNHHILENVVKEMFGEKIERILVDVVKQTISQEIDRLKETLLKDLKGDE